MDRLLFEISELKKRVSLLKDNEAFNHKEKIIDCLWECKSKFFIYSYAIDQMLKREDGGGTEIEAFAHQMKEMVIRIEGLLSNVCPSYFVG